jgi:acyl-coenzyme A synthetase/AMP-(fatty) acid ligase
MVQPWLEARDMQAIVADPVQQWFPKHDVVKFTWEKTFEEAEWDPALILHTSGSTGIPKPITCRQGFFATLDRSHNHPEWNGTKTVLHTWTESMETLFLPCTAPISPFSSLLSMI